MGSAGEDHVPGPACAAPESDADHRIRRADRVADAGWDAARRLVPAGGENSGGGGRGMAARHYRIFPAFLVRIGLDNIGRMPRIHCPTLVFHGTADVLVPIKMGRDVAAAAGGPVDFVMIEGAGHNDTYDLGGDVY